MVYKATSQVVLARLSLSSNTIKYQNALPNTLDQLGEGFEMMSLGYFLNDWQFILAIPNLSNVLHSFPRGGPFDLFTLPTNQEFSVIFTNLQSDTCQTIPTLPSVTSTLTHNVGIFINQGPSSLYYVAYTDTLI